MKTLDRHPTRLLAAHAEGALDPARASRVAEHLASCTICAREWEGWQVLYRDLAHLRRPRVPAGLRDRIVQAIALDARPAPALAAQRPGRWEAIFSGAYAAGVAMAGAVIIGLALLPRVRESAASALAAASAFGLSAGLTVIDALSWVSGRVASLGSFLGQILDWTQALGRAVETIGGVAEMRLASVTVVCLGVLLLSLFLVRFLHQQEPEGEISHVGPLLA